MACSWTVHWFQKTWGFLLVQDMSNRVKEPPKQLLDKHPWMAELLKSETWQQITIRRKFALDSSETRR